MSAMVWDWKSMKNRCCGLGNEQIIEAGMVMCVEVGKYLSDVGGFQIEDTILVTETGIEIMSSLPKDICLPVK